MATQKVISDKSQTEMSEVSCIVTRATKVEWTTFLVSQAKPMSIRTTAFGFKQGNKFGDHLTIGLSLPVTTIIYGIMVASVVLQVNYGQLLLNKLDIRVFEITTLCFGPFFLLFMLVSPK